MKRSVTTRISYCTNIGVIMKSIELNEIPNLLKEKKMSQEEGIIFLTNFISENYLIFGNRLRDEDFRSEVILSFLEKSDSLFKNYNENRGTFFSYFYSYIQNSALYLTKIKNKESVLKKITKSEIEQNYSNKMEKEETLKIEENKVQYSSKKISKENIKKTLTEITKKKTKYEKIILTLTLKNSFYLTDDLIKKISNFLKIDTSLLSEIVMNYKTEMENKILRREEVFSKRDKSYFLHKKCEKEIDDLKTKRNLDFDTDIQYATNRKLEKLYYVNKKHITRWNSINKEILEGKINIKPSNHSIANMMGICERQVSYYLFCVKNGKTNFSELQEKTKEIKDEASENITNY